jgi:nucleoside-diphosphate-sugar epimerase
MTIMVTGASGFVGLNLLERLLTDGKSVVSYSRSPLDPWLLQRFARLPGRLVVIAGDVRDASLITASLGDHCVTSLVHMATITASAEREKVAASSIIDVNLGGLAVALTAAAETGVTRFVYAGSVAVFGPNTVDGGLIEEDHPHDPRTLYALTKSAGEDVTARLGDLHGLDWVIGRIGRVFGPYEHETGVRDTMSQIYQATMSARAGRAVSFDRPCLKNWNYAPDTAADLATLATSYLLPARVYNLGAPFVWSLEDWCIRLARAEPGFKFSVGAKIDGAIDIDLVGLKDGGLLSWSRFEHDFGRSSPHGLDDAFEDYRRFLSHSADPVFS